MKLVWTDAALRDLREVSAYIAENNPSAAARVRDRIRNSVRRLAEFPLSGRAGRVAETRELVVPGTAYLVPYRVRAERIEILAIFHAAREFPEEM